MSPVNLNSPEDRCAGAGPAAGPSRSDRDGDRVGHCAPTWRQLVTRIAPTGPLAAGPQSRLDRRQSATQRQIGTRMLTGIAKPAQSCRDRLRWSRAPAGAAACSPAAAMALCPIQTLWWRARFKSLAPLAETWTAISCDSDIQQHLQPPWCKPVNFEIYFFKTLALENTTLWCWIQRNYFYHSLMNGNYKLSRIVGKIFPLAISPLLKHAKLIRAKLIRSTLHACVVSLIYSSHCCHSILLMWSQVLKHPAST